MRKRRLVVNKDKLSGVVTPKGRVVFYFLCFCGLGIWGGGEILFIFHFSFIIVLGSRWNWVEWTRLPIRNLFPYPPIAETSPSSMSPPGGVFSHRSQACVDAPSCRVHRIQSCAFWSVDKYLAAGVDHYSTSYESLPYPKSPLGPTWPSLLGYWKTFSFFSLFFNVLYDFSDKKKINMLFKENLYDIKSDCILSLPHDSETLCVNL